MGAKLWRLAADAVWRILELLASMLPGALVCGVGGFVLGLLADGVGASGALQTGAL